MITTKFPAEVEIAFPDPMDAFDCGFEKVKPYRIALQTHLLLSNLRFKLPDGAELVLTKTLINKIQGEILPEVENDWIVFFRTEKEDGRVFPNRIVDRRVVVEESASVPETGPTSFSKRASNAIKDTLTEALRGLGVTCAGTFLDPYRWSVSDLATDLAPRLQKMFTELTTDDPIIVDNERA